MTDIEILFYKCLVPEEKLTYTDEIRLRPSTDLCDNLRHVQLRAAKAPTISKHVQADVRAMTGTLWHNFIDQRLQELGVPHMNSIFLGAGMPKGWSGTADWLIWDEEDGGFTLVDLKTTSEMALNFSLPKPEHVAQVSAYYYAAKAMGFPLLPDCRIIYFPLDGGFSRKKEGLEYRVESFLPYGGVFERMGEIHNDVEDYITSLDFDYRNPQEFMDGKDWFDGTRYLTDALAPEQDRVQRVFKDKDKFTLKLVPHWTAQFCPFPTFLCGCSEQGENKIGEFVDAGGFGWKYVPRKGFEHHEIKVTFDYERGKVINDEQRSYS